MKSGRVRRKDLDRDGPSNRGQKRVLTRSDTARIAGYLKHCAFRNKSLTWRKIAFRSGIKIAYDLTEETIHKACKVDEKLNTRKPPEERLLSPRIADARLEWVRKMREQRPNPEDWRDVVFTDEFHFVLQGQSTPLIKRKDGERNNPENVFRKEVTRKDEKIKGREKDSVQLLNVFVAVGLNYRHVIKYDAGNKNGKMNSVVYKEQILSRLIPEFRERGLTLFQDADSAHKSKASLSFMGEYLGGIPYITNASCSPDLSIVESLAWPLKVKYESKRTILEDDAWAHFVECFIHDLEESTIERLYSSYLARFQAVEECDGQMTKY